ncbi:MAG: branched-chain amino acid ABC transporter permease [Leucobacter sp.]
MVEGIVSGLVAGSAYAIIAVCVVILYRLVGLLNFSQAAIGALGAYTAYALNGPAFPLAVAVLIGILASGLIAGLAGWIMAVWFGEASIMARSAVTIVLLILLLTLGFRLFGNSPRVMPSIVPEASFQVGGVWISLTTLVALAVTFALAGLLTLVLRRSNIGHRLQAMSERPTTAQLLGVNSRLLSVGVWVVAGMVSSIAILLIAPSQNPTFGTLSFLVVPALAAGLIGAFSNVWIAVVSGLAIGIIEGAGARISVISDYRGAVPFLVIILALIWLRRKAVWDAAR